MVWNFTLYMCFVCSRHRCPLMISIKWAEQKTFLAQKLESMHIYLAITSPVSIWHCCEDWSKVIWKNTSFHKVFLPLMNSSDAFVFGLIYTCKKQNRLLDLWSVSSLLAVKLTALTRRCILKYWVPFPRFWCCWFIWNRWLAVLNSGAVEVQYCLSRTYQRICAVDFLQWI